jgi:hypothetical protein
MRVPRARFTVRTMMIAVAATGLILAVWAQTWNLYRFSTDCRQRTASYAILREVTTNNLAVARKLRRLAVGGSAVETVALSAKYEKVVEDWERRVAYWSMMEKKYRRAGARPWLTVAPDPTP